MAVMPTASVMPPMNEPASKCRSQVSTDASAEEPMSKLKKPAKTTK